MPCPNNFQNITNVIVNRDMTFSTYLCIKIDSGIENRYIQTYTGDTSSLTPDALNPLYGWEGTTSVTFATYKQVVVSGYSYYIRVFSGDVQTDCCSTLIGEELSDGTFTSAGYLIVDVNSSNKFIHLYDRLNSSSSSSFSSSSISSESSESSSSISSESSESSSSNSSSSISSQSSESSSSISSESSVSSESSSSISYESSESSGYDCIDVHGDGKDWFGVSVNGTYLANGYYNGEKYYRQVIQTSLDRFYIWFNVTNWALTDSLGSVVSSNFYCNNLIGTYNPANGSGHPITDWCTNSTSSISSESSSSSISSESSLSSQSGEPSSNSSSSISSESSNSSSSISSASSLSSLSSESSASSISSISSNSSNSSSSNSSSSNSSSSISSNSSESSVSEKSSASSASSSSSNSSSSKSSSSNSSSSYSSSSYSSSSNSSESSSSESSESSSSNSSSSSSSSLQQAEWNICDLTLKIKKFILP